MLECPLDVKADFSVEFCMLLVAIFLRRIWLQKLIEAKGDLFNITETVPTGEEDVKVTANELGVVEHDGFDEENNISLSE